MVQGRSAVLYSCSSNPLRLLTPCINRESVWAYLSSFGGGMVAGDQTSMKVTVDRNARCFLGTQASTKIYKNHLSRPCAHHLNATIGNNALLVFTPDPVQCFAGSTFDQCQRFDLEQASNLVLLDWVSSGRAARGERWAMNRYSSRNEIRREDRLIFLDALKLEPAETKLGNPFRTGGYHCFATVLLLGPLLAGHAAKILEAFASQPPPCREPVLASASPLEDGAVLRFAGTHVQEVAAAIFRHLQFVAELLNDNPWLRKW
ncbi:MAG: urease accessory protein UreD [Verrucomicrobiota bacterium]|nr:urease accessory protein UreD [Verrucomicrobiota bacterium]